MQRRALAQKRQDPPLTDDRRSPKRSRAHSGVLLGEREAASPATGCAFCHSEEEDDDEAHRSVCPACARSHLEVRGALANLIAELRAAQGARFPLGLRLSVAINVGERALRSAVQK